MKEKDDRTYVRVHDGMPDHPKVVGLSDAAFRLYVEAMCYCSRHLTNGHLTAPALRKMGAPKSLRELTAAGLLEAAGDGYDMHDYLEHQRSAEEVAAIKTARAVGGSVGNHKRWHEGRGKPDPDCPLCIAEPIGGAIGGESQDRSLNGRKTSPETETETERKELPPDPPRRKRPETDLPTDFTVLPSMRSWAVETAPHADVDRETAKFLDHHAAKGSRFRDWGRAWQTWMRNAEEFELRRLPPQRGGKVLAIGSNRLADYPDDYPEEWRYQ